MKKLFENYFFNVFVIVALAMIALYFSLRGHYQEVMTSLRQVDVWWFFILAGYALLYQFLVGIVLTNLTRMSNPSYSYFKGFINAVIASFFHGITPSASGGQFAQFYVYKKQRVDSADAASILWIDFIIYQSAMVITVLVLLIIRFGDFYHHHRELFTLVLLGFLINVAIIVGFWAISRFSKFYTWISTKGVQIAHRFKIVKDEKQAVEKLNKSIARFDEETKKFQAHKLLIVKVFLINVVRLCVYYALPYLVAMALSIEIPFTMLIDVMALTAFVSMINAFIPIPGASGGTEATFLLMFTTIVSASQATGMMILWRSFSYYFIMIFGAIVFALFKYYYARKEGA